MAFATTLVLGFPSASLWDEDCRTTNVQGIYDVSGLAFTSERKREDES